MAKRKQGGLDLIASLPWPAGLIVGVLAYAAIRYGLGYYFSASGSQLLSGVGQQASAGAFTPLAWFALAACWAAAGVSAYRRSKRNTLFETQTGLASLTKLSWQEFEMLAGESFRRRGFTVEETGLGGKDGGIDLIVRKDGRTELVQCKQWKNRQITIATVREMWGLKTHHGADGVHIVCIGDFTPDAAAFSSGKPIQLVTGEALLEMIRAAKATPAAALVSAAVNPSPAPAPAACPVCGGEMVKRTNRRNGQTFMGCSNYPRCRGTQVWPR